MPMHHTTRRIILKEFPGRTAAASFAEQHGWEMYSDTAFGQNVPPDRPTAVEVMWLVHHDISFFYVENYLSYDSCVGFTYTRPPGAEIDALMQELEHDLDNWSADELLRQADVASSPDEHGRAIIRVGLGAPVDFNQEFYDRIGRAARHPGPMVRETAVAAMMYPAWPQFRPLLRSLTENDPAENVRMRATNLLDSYDRVGVPDP